MGDDLAGGGVAVRLVGDVEVEQRRHVLVAGDRAQLLADEARDVQALGVGEYLADPVVPHEHKQRERERDDDPEAQQHADAACPGTAAVVRLPGQLAGGADAGHVAGDDVQLVAARLLDRLRLALLGEGAAHLGADALRLSLAEFVKIGEHIVDGGVAVVRLRLHGPQRDLLQLGGNLGVQGGRILGGDREVLDGDLREGVAGVRQAARQHLVHDDAEGVDVAAGVDGLAACLLGGDVMDAAQPLLGVLPALDAVLELGDAEVGDLRGAVLREHDVLGLDVHVDDAPAVGVAERTGDLGGEVQRLLPRKHALLFEVLVEADALDVLHHDVLRVAGGHHVVDGADIRVAQLPDGLVFRAEPAAGLRVHRHVVAQNLDRHIPLELCIVCAVDVRHAADAEHRHDLVATVQRLAESPAHFILHCQRFPFHR